MKKILITGGSGLLGQYLNLAGIEKFNIFTKTYGGISYDYASSIIETDDGGFAITGYTQSSGAGSYDFWLIKTDADGEILWQHVFDEEAYEQVSFNSAAVLPEGGYVFAGRALPTGESYWDMLQVKPTAGGE